MTSKKLFYLLVAGISAAGILAIATLALGNHVLTNESLNLVSLRLKVQSLAEQQDALAQAKQDVAKYTPLNNIAESVVPQEKDQALAVREITDIASQANIAIASITFPTSTLGNSTSSSTSSSKSTSSTPSISQLSPAKGIPGIYVMPITVTSDATKPISYSQLISFLQALENNRQTAEVSQLTITPTDNTGQNLSVTLVVNIYIKP